MTCVSATAAALEATETVYNASEGPANISVTFTSGVVVGATYECSVKMKKDNYTSAKSAPSIVTVQLTGTEAEAVSVSVLFSK